MARLEDLENHYSSLLWKVAFGAGGMSIVVTVLGILIDLAVRK